MKWERQRDVLFYGLVEKNELSGKKTREEKNLLNFKPQTCFLVQHLYLVSPQNMMWHRLKPWGNKIKKISVIHLTAFGLMSNMFAAWFRKIYLKLKFLCQTRELYRTRLFVWGWVLFRVIRLFCFTSIFWWILNIELNTILHRKSFLLFSASGMNSAREEVLNSTHDVTHNLVNDLERALMNNIFSLLHFAVQSLRSFSHEWLNRWNIQLNYSTSKQNLRWQLKFEHRRRHSKLTESLCFAFQFTCIPKIFVKPWQTSLKMIAHPSRKLYGRSMIQNSIEFSMKSPLESTRPNLPLLQFTNHYTAIFYLKPFILFGRWRQLRLAIFFRRVCITTCKSLEPSLVVVCWR